MARSNNVYQIYNGSAAYDLYKKETYEYYGNAAPEIQRQGLPEERILPEKRQRVKVKAAVAPFAALPPGQEAGLFYCVGDDSVAFLICRQLRSKKYLLLRK